MPPLLRFKHRLATSPLAGPVAALRSLGGRVQALLHPQLGPLFREPRLTDACLARMIRPDWNCLDVGGHIGSMAFRLSRLAPQGHLTIVEATPAKAAALRARFPQATVHGVAVSDRTGEADFYENMAQPGFSSLSNRTSRGETRTIRVPVMRLDDLLPRDRPVHFIKLDVEGHEPAALRGAEATLRAHRPAILFEAGAVEDHDLDASGYDRMFAFLQDLGYAIRPVFGQHRGSAPLDLAAFRACRRYPFTAFNFFATAGVPA